MKKYFWLFFISCFLVSCTPKLFTHGTYYVDYQKAGEGRVFITESNSVSFDYEPLGSIVVVEESGSIKVKSSPSSDKNSGEMIEPIYAEREDKYEYVRATAQTALNYACKRVVGIGGDAIINLNIILSGYYNSPIVTVSGMVVRKK